MTLSRIGFASLLALSLVTATGSAGGAATPQCNAELRKCNSHCNLVYESKRSNRVCRDRCKDKFYVCKARPA
jgi:hypothetical protein